MSWRTLLVSLIVRKVSLVAPLNILAIIEKRPVKSVNLQPLSVQLLKERFKDFLAIAPSSMHKHIMRFTSGAGSLVASNRPYMDTEMPITLIDEVFARFDKWCQEPPTERGLQFLEELAPAACIYYSKYDPGQEDTRVRLISQVVYRHTGFHLSQDTLPEVVDGESFQVDGIARHHQLVYIIRECKGDTLEDAIRQLTMYYTRYIKREIATNAVLAGSHSRFPVFGFVDTGMSICLSTFTSIFIYFSPRLKCAVDWPHLG